MRRRGRQKKKPSVWSRWRAAWSQVNGTVYLIRSEHPENRRLCKAYVGKYAGPWQERIRQHAYGGGPYRCEAKSWADTIPGYDPHARSLAAQRRAVARMVAMGSAEILWQKRCFYWWLKKRESFSITWHRPVYNDLENHHNRRRITKQDALVQRALRDKGAAAHLLFAGSGWSVRRNADEEIVGVRSYGREPRVFPSYAERMQVM